MPLHRWSRSLRLRARRHPRRHRRLPPARLLAGMAAGIGGLVLPTAPLGSQPAADPHLPPVTAPVADPFRPPTHPFGPGNRGIEYATVSGDDVRASAAGTVAFAGDVAESLHVTLLHPDGVRTSYSYLATVDVGVGQVVGQGDLLGRAGGRFHFGARRGNDYFDPASLFMAGSAGPIEVELLPFELPPGASPDEERMALLQLDRSPDGALSFAHLGAMAGWGVDRIRLFQHYGSELSQVSRGLDVTRDITSRLAFPAPCSDAPPPDRPAAGLERRAAVLVGGLGSSSESASIDGLRVNELGYRPEDVVRFSYAGGRAPGTGHAFAHLDTSTYVSADTQGDLSASALRLADLVQAALAEQPDVIVDLYGHSMGGVVTRLALAEMERRGVDLGRLGLVATFGSPHQGADLATAVAAATASPGSDERLTVLADAMATGLDPRSPAAAQLSETSEVVAGLAAAGVPDGVRLVSFAASGDLIVTAPNTEVDGARNVTVSLAGRDAHGDLVGHPETTAEVARALADQPPGCESPGEIVGETVLGAGLSYMEDFSGFAALQPAG